MNSKTEAAQKVAADLMQLELSLDEALVRFGSIVSSLPAARVQAELSAVTGHKAFQLLNPIGEAIVAARGKAVDLHNCLEAVRRQASIEMSPPWGDKPPQLLEAAALKVVAAA